MVIQVHRELKNDFHTMGPINQGVLRYTTCNIFIYAMVHQLQRDIFLYRRPTGVLNLTSL